VDGWSGSCPPYIELSGGRRAIQWGPKWRRVELQWRLVAGRGSDKARPFQLGKGEEEAASHLLTWRRVAWGARCGGNNTEEDE
jgi:hypothetical protein